LSVPEPSWRKLRRHRRQQIELFGSQFPKPT
jgi:hypothetical protein